MNTNLKHPWAPCCALLTLCILSIWSCDPSSQDTAVTMTQDQLIERGKYLVEAADCNGCHTPLSLTSNGLGNDSTRFLAGYPENIPLPFIDTATINGGAMIHTKYGAFAGPWGVSFPANLTPDQTGLGGWDASIFIRTMRFGKYHGVMSGRALLPPMPWQSFRNFSDEDLTAMFAFLGTLPAIHNRVPDPILFDQMNKKKSAAAIKATVSLK